MTRERALQLIELQSKWPNWGNFTKFMTADERAELDALWAKAPGEWSRSNIIYALANGQKIPKDGAYK